MTQDHQTFSSVNGQSQSVMDQGKIVESESYDELVAKNGMYARSKMQQTYAMDAPSAPASAGY